MKFMLNENVLPGTKKYILTLLIIILLIGSILRIYGLDKQSLWNDELESWRQANFDRLSAVIKILTNIEPPGYRILLYFIEKYIGDSEIILRLPSVISGILSIFAIFILGLRCYSIREALIASSLMSVCLCPILYSQEARPYSMLLLFSILASYFWFLTVDILREKIKISKYIITAYVICAIALSYLHYFGFFLIVLQGLYTSLVFIKKRRVLIEVVLIYVAILLAYGPWMPFMLKHLSARPGWILAPKHNILYTFIDYLSFIFEQKKIVAKVILVLYLYLFFYNLYRFIKRKEYKKPTFNFFSPGFILFLWLVVPFTAVYIKSVLSTPMLVYRYLIISLPPAYLIASRSIAQLTYRVKNQLIIIIAVMSIFVFNLFNTNHFSSVYKEEIRSAVNFIVEHDKIYENSLIIGYAYNCDYFNYYFKKFGYPKVLNIILGGEGDIQNAIGIINKEKVDYIWYIWAFRSPDADFIGGLRKNLDLMDYRKFFNAEVYLFKKKNNIGLSHIGKIRFEAEDAPSFIGRKVRDGLAENKYAKCATLFREGKKDILLAYGPFFELPKGDYIAGFRIKISDNNIDRAVVRIDVNNPEKKEPLIAEKNICGMEFDKPKQYRDFYIEFNHDGEGKLEFRVHYLGETDVWVDYVEIMDRNVIDKGA